MENLLLPQFGNKFFLKQQYGCIKLEFLELPATGYLPPSIFLS